MWWQNKITIYSRLIVQKTYLFHDGGPYHIETCQLICSANQWIGSYIIGTSVMKELKNHNSNIQRCGQDNHTNVRWRGLQKYLTIKATNYCCKALRLRSLLGSRPRLWYPVWPNFHFSKNNEESLKTFDR